ncbi:hypothetical protein ACFQ0M_23665 [Kitasatospora aburaviensis]
MPTPSTSPPTTSRRHAAPADRDRLGTFLTASWAALHLPVLTLLGLAVHHHPAEASPRARRPRPTYLPPEAPRAAAPTPSSFLHSLAREETQPCTG